MIFCYSNVFNHQRYFKTFNGSAFHLKFNDWTLKILLLCFDQRSEISIRINVKPSRLTQSLKYTSFEVSGRNFGFINFILGL